ncbi:uncharacterized protein METZ01_LOCUS291872, partial [marine metagenome]
QSVVEPSDVSSLYKAYLIHCIMIYMATSRVGSSSSLRLPISVSSFVWWLDDGFGLL